MMNLLRISLIASILGIAGVTNAYALEVAGPVGADTTAEGPCHLRASEPSASGGVTARAYLACDALGPGAPSTEFNADLVVCVESLSGLPGACSQNFRSGYGSLRLSGSATAACAGVGTLWRTTAYATVRTNSGTMRVSAASLPALGC